MTAHIVACLGKGGTGKTLVSTLLGRIARELGKKVLLIDADPVMGLAVACGLGNVTTIAQAREEIIEQVRNISGSTSDEELREIVGFIISRTLVEKEGMAFLAMGQSSSVGCYCSLNLLLRKMISSLAERFDFVVIDAEAGIEQINRQVVERIDDALLLSDASLRGVRTCLLARDTIARIPLMSRCRMSLLFNRVSTIPNEHRLLLEKEGIPIIGALPADEEVRTADVHQGAMHILGSENSFYRMLREVIAKAEILERNL